MARKKVAALDNSGIARASMLRIAKSWHTLGSINQAVDVYNRLMERHPASEEAREAGKMLMDLAQTYEKQGRYHMAIAIYEKLERPYACE